jgi:hypothetical protein
VDHPKKPGRPQGHAAAARPLPDHVDRTLEALIEVCPECQVPANRHVIAELFPPDPRTVSAFPNRLDAVKIGGVSGAPSRGGALPQRRGTSTKSPTGNRQRPHRGGLYER